MVSNIDDIDLDELCLDYQKSILDLSTNNINAEGKQFLCDFPDTCLTPELIDQFYTRHHINFSRYPFHSLAMIDAEHLNDERLAAIKKYDLRGLAHYHYNKLTPGEYAQGIGYNLNLIKKSAQMIAEADYLLAVTQLCLAHHGFDSDYELIVGATNKRQAHWPFCQFMIKTKGLEQVGPLVKTSAQRKMLVELFGIDQVSAVLKLTAREKRAGLSDDLGL